MDVLHTARVERAAIIAVSVLVMTLMSVRTARACECRTLSPCEGLSHADLIFTATVTEMWPQMAADGRSTSGTLTRIVADRAFVGQTGTFVVRDDLSTCAYRFRVGERYLVFATRRADGDLAVSICSRTKELRQADEDLESLTTLPPPGTGGDITGSVDRLQIDLLGEDKGTRRPAIGVPLTLTGPNGERRALLSDSTGQIGAASLPPGHYQVNVGGPPTTKALVEPEKFRLADRGCASVHATLIPNGRIQGRVLDRGGEGVASALVTLMPAAFTNREEFPRAWIRNTGSTKNGGFEFDGLPPGDYHIGVNIDGPRLDIPYAPAWFPDVPVRMKTMSVRLAEGELRSGVDVFLADRLRAVSIAGVVLLPDGTPAADLEVRLLRSGQRLLISSTRTDGRGSFEVTGLAGFPFSVEASVYQSHTDRWGASTTVELGEEPVRDLRLTLKPVR